MNLIKLTICADLSQQSFVLAVQQLQQFEGENISVCLVVSPKNTKLGIEIQDHFFRLQKFGHRAEGAFIIPRDIALAPHQGMARDEWLVIGNENIIYSPGV